MTITIDDIRNPNKPSGFDYVCFEGRARRYRACHNRPRPRPAGVSSALWRGPNRIAAEQAAQDYCDWHNGQPLQVIERVLAPLNPRDRDRVVVTAMRKASWPKRMRDAIIARDKVCQHCGIEYPYLQADHIDPDGPHALDNGQALCPNCHTIKTREEQA